MTSKQGNASTEVAAKRREWSRLKRRARDAAKGQRETTARTLKTFVHRNLAAEIGNPELIDRVNRCHFSVGRL